MNPDPAIRVIDEADAGIVDRLRDEISAFNFATTGIRDGRLLFAAVRDASGDLMAGAYGWTWGETCWIELLWVRAGDRRHGIGQAVLAAVEREARARGCAQIGLTTHSFQAPDFYRRHGFEAVGEMSDYPVGHSYFVMRKRLD
jgi:GNAT superfamily N-acetyltransferase